MEVKLQTFLIPTLNGSVWSTSCPGHSKPGERASGTHCIGGWVIPQVSLDVAAKKSLLLPGIKPQSLNWLNYFRSVTVARFDIFTAMNIQVAVF
jgi:hypothetical protein